MDSEAKKNKYEIDMCSGPLLPKLISFSIPLILSQNLQLFFNAADLIVVGKYGGKIPLAAVGSTSALINIFIMLLVGISLGTNVIAARYYAAKDKKGMESIVHTSITFALIGGIVLSAVGILLAKPILILMATPENVLIQAVTYIRIYFLGLPFFMLYTYGAAILRAVGDTKRPLIYLVIAGIVNVLLNLVMVICFHLGVVGVAVATVISQLISCIFILRCLFKTTESYQLHLKKLKLNSLQLKHLLKIGLPAGIQSFVINVSNALLQSSVNSFGEIAIAGYTAANNIFGFMYTTANCFTQACMSFMSQNYAKRNWDRMKKVLKNCIFLSTVTMLIIGCGVFFFGEHILSIYNSDSAVIKCGMDVFLYTTITYFIFGIMDLLPGALRGIGHSTVPMILSIVGTVGVRVFWIYCVFPYHHTLSALFISYPLSWLVTVLMQVVYMFYAWKKAHITKT